MAVSFSDTEEGEEHAQNTLNIKILYNTGEQKHVCIWAGKGQNSAEVQYFGISKTEMSGL